jgi:outer membrane protein assembly factor BamB
MAKSRNILLIGIGGHVVAIDPSTGSEVWRTTLRSSDHATVWTDGKYVFAGSEGELFCLDPVAGDILWRNRLKGLGTGVIAFPSSSEQVILAVAAVRAAAASAG